MNTDEMLSQLERRNIDFWEVDRDKAHRLARIIRTSDETHEAAKQLLLWGQVCGCEELGDCDWCRRALRLEKALQAQTRAREERCKKGSEFIRKRLVPSSD